MNNLTRIEPSELTQNFIKLIGKDWMLISAGNTDNYNTMTANWGSIGYYANQSIATIFVRPERYTYDFVEHSDRFTLTFFGAEFREALSLLGKLSGRDCNKVEQSGLTPCFTELGNPSFIEAKLVMECRKIFGQQMCEESFVDKSCLERWYGGSHGGLHKMYIGVIEKCWIQ